MALTHETSFAAMLIGGAHSGCGKTTLTLGILRALVRRGKRVAPFKCGPDYIDPLLHRQAAGRASINLDGFFGNIESAYRQFGAAAEVAVVEGVMGLFDGIGRGRELTGSSAEVAARLRLPVFLAVSARGVAQSLAPLVKGFVEWHPEVRIAGVIANQVGSAAHGRQLAEILAENGLPPLVGVLPRDAALTLPERHLGLRTGELDEAWLNDLADRVEASLELDRMLELAAVAPPAPAPVIPLPPVRFRLGGARDAAFLFYYEENFRLFRQHGVELVPFSPLRDRELPPHLDGLYFGGGYPELFAAELAGNVAMRQAVRDFGKNHFIYGECGGYLYLLEQLGDADGRLHPMTGLLPGTAVLREKAAALGYREALGRWGRVRGHEFHYTELTAPPSGEALFPVARDRRGRELAAGSVRGRVMGSYLHVHFAANPGALALFLRELEQ